MAYGKRTKRKLTYNTPRSAKKPRVWAPGSKKRNTRTGGFLGIELKYRDVGIALTTIPTAMTQMDPPTDGHLVPVGQGNSPDQRDGTKLALKSLYIHGMVRWLGQDDETAIDHPGPVRIVIFQDTQTNKANPVPIGNEDSGSLFANPAGGGSGLMVFRDLAGTARYKVLGEKWITPNLAGGVGGSGTGAEFSSNGVNVPFVFHFPNLAINMKFNAGATGVIGDVLDHSVHICAVNGGDRNAQLQYVCRSRWYS